jgi:hypothetical protein
VLKASIRERGGRDSRESINERPDSDGGRGSSHALRISISGEGLSGQTTPMIQVFGSGPDDSVLGVGEFRCAGRLGPGRRE